MVGVGGSIHQVLPARIDLIVVLKVGGSRYWDSDVQFRRWLDKPRRRAASNHANENNSRTMAWSDGRLYSSGSAKSSPSGADNTRDVHLVRFQVGKL